MPVTVDEVDRRLDTLEKTLELRIETAQKDNELFISKSTEPFRRFMYGATAIVAFIVIVGGAWIRSTFVEFTQATKRSDEMVAKTGQISSELERLQKELRILDENIQKRVDVVQERVETLSAEPPAPIEVQGNAAQNGGTITHPNSGAEVGSQFLARGSVTLENRETAWLAVRVGGLYWPKEPSITESGVWQRTIYEGGTPGRKALALVIVDDELNDVILQWFETGHRTGSYPGLNLGSRARVIAEIPFVLVR